MVLKITDICNMGCSHCLSDCTMRSLNPCMTEKVLNDSIDFINQMSPLTLIVSGGEPTLHPDFIEYIHTIRRRLKNTFAVIITSNGEWVLKHKKEALSVIYRLDDNGPVVTWQITTDKRFYPRQIDRTDPIWKEKGMFLCEEPIQKVYPIGRALDNNLGENYSCSQCYNPRAISNQPGHNTFFDVVHSLEIAQKFCHPCINTDGSITLGESSLCKRVGTIYDTDKDLFKKTQNFTCKKCQWINERLPEKYKKLIHFE